MKKPRGIHHYRLNGYNPREVAFAKTWEEEHQRTDLLQQLMRRPPRANEVPDWHGGVGPPQVTVYDTSKRDIEIATTVIQWMGSNVGMSFLQKSLRKCGYIVIKKDA